VKRDSKRTPMDLVRLIPLVLISEFLYLLLLHHFNNTGKKYGFDILPRDNRHFLDIVMLLF
jgi:hypothetical protein